MIGVHRASVGNLEEGRHVIRLRWHGQLREMDLVQSVYLDGL